MDDLRDLLRAAQAALASGDPDAAAALFGRAAAMRPDQAVLHNEHGIALAMAGRAGEALAALRRAAAMAPEVAAIWNNLGSACRVAGRLDESIDACRRAIAMDTGYAEAHGNLGAALQLAGDLEGALAACRQAVAIKPTDALAQTRLGTALAAAGQLMAAEAAHRAATAAQPDLADAHNNLGIVLKDIGRFDAAAEAYRRALAIRPDDAAIHSNLLMSLCYDPAVDGDALFAAHCAWAGRHAHLSPVTFTNDRDSMRPLRIGFVSPDFREHSVAAFIEPVLAARPREEWQAFCYAEVGAPDAATARLRALADGWCWTVGLSDPALADRIRADQVDVLFDLAGHTAHNRLGVFARRAAPIQATWIGYPATTGLAAMDYRLTDMFADPPGAADRQHAETLVRLPGCFLCYAPPLDAPPLADERRERPVTFGSFNNLSKMTPAVVKLWAQVLRAVPASRMLLKSRQLADPQVAATMRAAFAAHGIAPDRLDLRGRIGGRAAHLALYSAIDVALDTFPYNGATTTCEALWMGVPVVTLAGDRHAGRVGVSLLQAAGYADWIAPDEVAYLAVACGLAAGCPAPAAIRSQIMASSLTDSAGFAATFAATIRAWWRGWCERGG